MKAVPEVTGQQQGRRAAAQDSEGRGPWEVGGEKGTVTEE